MVTKITIEDNDDKRIIEVDAFFIAYKSTGQNCEIQDENYESLYSAKEYDFFKFDEALIYTQHKIAEQACCKKRKKELLKALVQFAKGDLESKEYILEQFLKDEND